MTTLITGTFETTAGGHSFSATLKAPRTYQVDGTATTAGTFISAAADALKTIVTSPTATAKFYISDLSSLISLAGGDVDE